MSNSDRGNKLTCPACQSKFYDLNRWLIDCPSCFARWWAQWAIDSPLSFDLLSTGCTIDYESTSQNGHHSVYVVLLSGVPKVTADSYYVGMTGNAVERRLLDHKRNHKAGKGFVRDYGVALIPALFKDFRQLPYEAAKMLEPALAEKLKRDGLTVFGGH